MFKYPCPPYALRPINQFRNGHSLRMGSIAKAGESENAAATAAVVAATIPQCDSSTSTSDFRLLNSYILRRASPHCV